MEHQRYLLKLIINVSKRPICKDRLSLSVLNTPHYWLDWCLQLECFSFICTVQSFVKLYHCRKPVSHVTAHVGTVPVQDLTSVWLVTVILLFTPWRTAVPAAVGLEGTTLTAVFVTAAQVEICHRIRIKILWMQQSSKVFFLLLSLF